MDLLLVAAAAAVGGVVVAGPLGARPAAGGGGVGAGLQGEEGVRHTWARMEKKKNEDRTCMKRKVAEELCDLGQ